MYAMPIYTQLSNLHMNSDARDLKFYCTGGTNGRQCRCVIVRLAGGQVNAAGMLERLT
jgi:hypothetical protein